MDTADLPVDLGRLVDWMDSRGLGHGPIADAQLLAGGTQNVLLRFTRGGDGYVLRRPPRHPRPESNRIMQREARVLAALAGSDVPHPRLIAACDDMAVLGVAFYLMAPVDGFNATVAMPGPVRADPRLRHRMGLELVDGLAALARVDHVAAGLADFGKAEGFVERQVPRWLGQLDGYRDQFGYDARAVLPGLDDLSAWLAANPPKSYRPGIFHGDYHIGNVIFRDDASLAAIVDWEMATIGDPLLDLGRFLATWWDDDGTLPYSLRLDPEDGFPGRAEVLDRYARGSDRDLADLGWFEVLACYKLGIIFEGSYARAQAGKADRAMGQRLHDNALALFRRALAWAQR